MWGQKITANSDSSKETRLARIISNELKKDRPHLSAYSRNAFMKPVYEPVVELAIRYQMISRHDESESNRIGYLNELLKILKQLMSAQDQDPKIVKKGKIIMLFLIDQICHAKSESELVKYVRQFQEIKETETMRKNPIDKYTVEYSNALQNFQGGHVSYEKDKTETQLLLTAILNKPQKTVISYLIPPLKEKNHYGVLLKYAQKYELNLEIELNIKNRQRLQWTLADFYEGYEAIREEYERFFDETRQGLPFLQLSPA